MIGRDNDAGRAGGESMRSERSRLAAVRAVLLDLDGVLYVEDAAIPGARDAVAALRRTSSRSPAAASRGAG
jgi:hypothetical protein